MTGHLTWCRDCSTANAELAGISAGLRGMVARAVLGEQIADYLGSGRLSDGRRRPRPAAPDAHADRAPSSAAGGGLPGRGSDRGDGRERHLSPPLSVPLPPRIAPSAVVSPHGAAGPDILVTGTAAPARRARRDRALRCRALRAPRPPVSSSVSAAPSPDGTVTVSPAPSPSMLRSERHRDVSQAQPDHSRERPAHHGSRGHGRGRCVRSRHGSDRSRIGQHVAADRDQPAGTRPKLRWMDVLGHQLPAQPARCGSGLDRLVPGPRCEPAGLRQRHHGQCGQRDAVSVGKLVGRYQLRALGPSLSRSALECADRGDADRSSAGSMATCPSGQVATPPERPRTMVDGASRRG